MRRPRAANIDTDIKVDDVRSKLVEACLHEMDSIMETDEAGQNTFYFTDIQNRFFTAITNPIAEYRYQLTEEDMQKVVEEMEDGYKLGVFDQFTFEPVTVPVVKVFYVPPYCRGRGIQSSFFDFLTSVSDDVGESFACFADPYKIIGCPRKVSAKEALYYFINNGYEKSDRYWIDSVKQRNRFIGNGLRNVEYYDASCTEPWQHFYYLSDKASAEEGQLIDKLERHFIVDEAKAAERDGINI